MLVVRVSFLDERAAKDEVPELDDCTDCSGRFLGMAWGPRLQSRASINQISIISSHDPQGRSRTHRNIGSLGEECRVLLSWGSGG